MRLKDQIFFVSLLNVEKKRYFLKTNMEHLVGIKVRDKIFGEVAFMTWGRIFHPVDPQTLLETVTKHLGKFGIKSPESIELCDTLQEISNHPYFFEGLFEFSQKTIPYGRTYKKWQQDTAKLMIKGEEIYFLGLTNAQKKRLKSRSLEP